MYGGGDAEQQASVARVWRSCSHLPRPYVRQAQLPTSRRRVRCRTQFPRALFYSRSSSAAVSCRTASRSILYQMSVMSPFWDRCK